MDFQCYEHHYQKSINLHCIGVEAEISKPGQIKPKLSAWLDTTKGMDRHFKDICNALESGHQ